MPYLAHVSLLVRDYDEAIAFYTRLGFELVEDKVIPEQHKRWVTIRTPSGRVSQDESIDRPGEVKVGQEVTHGSPPDFSAATILLARPSNKEQEMFIGNQTGGRVFLFLATEDFDRDYQAFSKAGVEWVREPTVEAYGKVAVWKDLYGNLWDLIQYR